MKMAAGGGSSSERIRLWLRDFGFRWTGTRTFVVSAAVIFLLLALFGALHPVVAFCSFLLLAGISATRLMVVGETMPIRLRAAEKTGMSDANGRRALALVNRLPDPLIVFDEAGRVVLANEAAEALVGKAAPGRHVATVLRSAPLIAAIEAVTKDGIQRTIEYSIPVPVQRHYSAYVARVESGEAGAFPVTLALLRDVTEAHRVEAMRADFVAFASHELKTPLASLSGFIDTLRGHARDDAEAREKFLEIMADQADRMRRLIDDLLSLSRIELREHVRPSDAVNLLDVVGDVADALGPLLTEHGVALTIDTEPSLPLVLGDRDELTQVVQNLADNALRYGHSGKRIDIILGRAERSGKPMLRLTVRDYGPGIAKEYLPRLTERFYRVDVAESRARGGTGLGLAIVKHIVNRHQGVLSIESEVGEGASFSVLLPLAPETVSAK